MSSSAHPRHRHHKMYGNAHARWKRSRHVRLAPNIVRLRVHFFGGFLKQAINSLKCTRASSKLDMDFASEMQLCRLSQIGGGEHVVLARHHKIGR